MADLNQMLQGKLPVSFLNEVCARRKLTPSYDVLANEGAIHEPVFVMKAQAGEFQGIGKGSSKKKAKHEAAQNLLAAMFNMSASTGDNTDGATDNSRQSLQKSVVGNTEPFDDDLLGNPIGELQEYTQKNLLRPPVYDFISEQGPPHAREFVCVVKLAKLQETAVGKSKKVAKRAAASKLLQSVQQMQTDSKSTAVFDDEEEDALPIGNGLMPSVKMKNIKVLTEEGGKRANEFFDKLRQNGGVGALLNGLGSLQLNDPCENFVIALATVGKEKKFDVQYLDINELSYSGQRQCLVQVCCNPIVVCHGTGLTQDDAHNHAAHNALQYLKVMTNRS